MPAENKNHKHKLGLNFFLLKSYSKKLFVYQFILVHVIFFVGKMGVLDCA